MAVSENRGTLFGGPFKGIPIYFGYKRGTPDVAHATSRPLKVPLGCDPPPEGWQPIRQVGYASCLVVE